MSKIKFFLSLIFPIILAILISVVLTSFQLRFLITSFKINSAEQQMPIISLFSNHETESPLNQITRINLIRGIFDDSGYTLSFFIKTGNLSQKETLLFYSTDKHLSALYWNISLVEGKIETARTEHITPIISDKKVNDNQWHQVLVTTNSNEERIYIDNKLSKNTLVDYLRTRDKWFVVNFNEKLSESEQIHLRDFIFINKDLTPRQFEIYQNHFLGNDAPLYRSIFFSLGKNLLMIVSFYLLLIFLIKSKYPKKSFFLITDDLFPKLFLYLLAAISFWTGYGYQISLICLFIFFYYVLQSYQNIFPTYLQTFVNIPISFLLRSLKLLRQLRIKEFFRYSASQKPEVYFCLFLFLGLLFSFNRFLFTNNLFRYCC